MPIREYVCQACGDKLERLQRLSDDPLTDCPACGEAALEKKISAVGFRLSGGGWYETDFKSDSRRNLSSDGEQSGASNSETSDSNSQSTSAESGGSGNAAASSGSDQSTSGQSSAGSSESTGKSQDQSKSKQSGTGDSGGAKAPSQSNAGTKSG